MKHLCLYIDKNYDTIYNFYNKADGEVKNTVNYIRKLCYKKYLKVWIVYWLKDTYNCSFDSKFLYIFKKVCIIFNKFIYFR